MKITAQLLLNAGTCADQVERFRALWPRGVTPSLAAWRKAKDAGLNWEQAKSLLSPEKRAAYEAARASVLIATLNAQPTKRLTRKGR